MSQTINKIYLHWTGTNYNWCVPGYYHTIILGNGKVRRLTGYDQTLKTHTYARNSNSVSICCSCMGGTAWQDFPPTEAQITAMCKEAANLAQRLGWKPSDINISRVLTHAEAAANRDFSIDLARRGSGVSLEVARRRGLPHDNYGPQRWHDGWPGGVADRWDWWQIKASDQGGVGGDILRRRIREFMQETADPEITRIERTPASGECKVFFNDKQICTGYLLSDNRCYVRLLDLITPLNIEIGKVRGGSVRYINLFSEDFIPKYLADSPIINGFLTVDIYMNRPEDREGNPVDDRDFPSQPFMQGIILRGSTHILVADFCNELGVKFAFRSQDRSIRVTR